MRSGNDKDRGLYQKFSSITRADGSSEPGGKHHGCSYFVLDLTHDQYAAAALHAYADACEQDFPALAADLRRMVESGVPGATAAEIMNGNE
jgi:hypothetical protein